MKKSVSTVQYQVLPMLVEDLVTQAAAIFLMDFRNNMLEHIKDVVRSGLRGNGGLIQEVRYWFDKCESDAQEHDGKNGHWDTEIMGPWVYGKTSPTDIANAVWRHTRGWKALDFENYGHTLDDLSEMNTAARLLA